MEKLNIPVHGDKITRLSDGMRLPTGERNQFGVSTVAIRHHPHKFANMTEKEMKEFLKEEQKEKGMHPSLQGKKF
jgi:hypothetical protein